MSVTWKARRRGLALITVAAVMLVGCSSGGNDKGASGQSSAAEANFDPNAVLRFSSAGPVPLLDPARQPSYGMQGYVALIYDRLTMINRNDEIVPGLATKWSFAADGSYLELTLRVDVTFHDGTKFDGAAVKANIERGQTLTGSTVVSALKDITQVEVVSPTVVRLHLNAGSGVQLPATFATNVGMMISPKAIADPAAKLSTDPGQAGSGPYVVSTFIPNEKLVLQRAKGNYWDPKAGRLGGIELTRVPEGATRLAGVQTNLTDLTFVSSPNDLVQAQQLGKSGVVQFDPTPARNVTGLYLRANQGDLTKPGVRQAIAHAIDPAAVNALFSGNCKPHQQLYPDSSWAAIKNYKYPYQFDTAKAKQLVQQAGGAKVTISFAASTNADQFANVVQGELAAVGIDAKLNPVPNSESEARFIAGDFELLAATSWNPSIDPADTVNTYLLNRYKLAPDPTEIAAAAAKGSDPKLSQDERAKIYAQIWETTMKEAWFVPVCQSTFGAVFNNRVLFADQIPWVNTGIWDLRYVAMKPAA